MLVQKSGNDLTKREKEKIRGLEDLHHEAARTLLILLGSRPEERKKMAQDYLRAARKGKLLVQTVMELLKKIAGEMEQERQC